MDIKKLLTKDTLIIVLLIALIPAWSLIYQKFLAPPPLPAKPALAAAATNDVVAEPVATAVKATVPVQPDVAPVAVPAAELRQPTAAPRSPETLVELTNALVRLTLSSHGGCIKSVELPAFTATKKSKDPVLLDFGTVPALAYGGLTGLDEFGDFKVTVISNGAAARIEGMNASGLKLTRVISLGNRYEVTIEDVLSNSSQNKMALPAHTLSIGSMGMLEGEAAMSGVDFLGVDTLSSTASEGVRHWSSKRWFSDDLTIADYFQETPRRGGGCVGRAPMTRILPLTIRQRIAADMDWVAVKNKFFVQILHPKGGSAGFDMIAERTKGPYEKAEESATWPGAAVPSRVAAAVNFPERTLAAGETYQRSLSYYVGPKELSSIVPLGLHKKEVMEFGMLRLLCEGLLWSLNKLNWLIPNYGIAIILLTLIVRIIFWPLTHKGTESMKRMQELQPQLKALQEKYKDKPQKLQQETMALYRENKVNPLGGCLPMLIQIPVFFALFSVLRSAVELRYASFLWVGDLSAPENLLQGMVPFIGSINLLPLLMTVTQIWQTKLTPAAGDPMQQKMMMWMMPIMMLLFLYSMPSALVLYWTANQVAMIVQLYWQRRMKKA